MHIIMMKFALGVVNKNNYGSQNTHLINVQEL